jgi:hypothetical protein
MFRHVVMFRWRADSTPEQRAASIGALRAFAADVADLGMVRVGVDAGMAEGNFDVAVIADFADQDGYRTYVDDPRHRTMVAEHIVPILDARVAVQSTFDQS